MDEPAHVAAAHVEVEHHIADTLARTVIGVAAAPPRLVNGKPLGVEQLGRVRAGAGGVEGRMLEKPHELGRVSFPDRLDPRLQPGENGRASGKARVVQAVEISGVRGIYKKKK